MTRVAHDSWTLGLASPLAGGSLTVREGRVRRWAANAGRPAGATGAFRLWRTVGATAASSATRFAWQLRRRPLEPGDADTRAGSGGGPRANPVRLDLTGRLAAREGWLRVALVEGPRHFEVNLRSTRRRNSVRATATRRARPGVPSQARVAVRWRAGRWRTGVLAAMRGDSLGVEAFAARGLALRAGRLEVSAGTRLGPVCEGRVHAGFMPRARLGPLRVTTGAGVAYRRHAGRGRLRPELSAGLHFGLLGTSARVGWEVSPAGLRMDGAPAMAARLETHAGPLAVSAALRPSQSGARWSASLQWSR